MGKGGTDRETATAPALLNYTRTIRTGRHQSELDQRRQ